MPVKFRITVERLRCDNVGEYVSNEFKIFCTNKRINYEYPIARNPGQNGIAERYNNKGKSKMNICFKSLKIFLE